MIMYRAMINIPGYLPQDDEDHLFDTIPEAWEWLYDRRLEDLDDPMNDEDDAADQALDEMIGMIDHPETGVVYGRTPGSDSDHDLGLAYSVSRVAELAHADYPHEPGRLHDCALCESRCFCTGEVEHALCVFCSMDQERQAEIDQDH